MIAPVPVHCFSITFNVMQEYRLPAPLVGMLKASKLTGKPIVKTELLPTKLHVVITWVLATSAQKKTKKRQLKKTANTESDNQQISKSSHHLQPPAPKPAPATPAPTPATPAPAPTVIRQPTEMPCPETLSPKVAAGRVGHQPMNKRPPPTPTTAAKRPAQSPYTSTDEDDSTKLQRREPPATINDAPLTANTDVSAADKIPHTGVQISSCEMVESPRQLHGSPTSSSCHLKMS